MPGRSSARLAIDIGGTFTDLALDSGAGATTAKVLTTSAAPENGVMDGIGVVLSRAGLAAQDISLIIHGTTLASNAIIERKGARTALLTTEGFRDSLEMAYENRFEQYDIWMDRPAPLVPREWRLPVPERIDARGRVVRPLDEPAVAALIPQLRASGIESVAVGYLHAYANPSHERRTRDILAAADADLWITISSEVCPEIREYERLSTTCVNAYIQPVLSGYLGRLDGRLKQMGLVCPLVLMTSGAGVTALETARKFPVRLVESGPAGGAILAAHIAAQCGYDKVVSFDMGGTTAKLCLIDDGQPQHARSLEVARQYRFLKGSGLPVRVPVIEMVEIGAGGGSIAKVDSLQRISVGPESAGSEPGPACYDRGGEAATVTDANLVIGRIDPARFAGGSIPLSVTKAVAAIERDTAGPLSLAAAAAAHGVVEVVNETMANAARVHAVERGKELAERVLIVFGGAGPLHAVRLAEKLEIDTLVVPTGAGVGSALGFLVAPVAYEIVHSRYMTMAAFSADELNALWREMRSDAQAVVDLTAPVAEIIETRTADMRYCGQGHELAVALPVRDFTPADSRLMRAAFAERYEALFDRTIPGLDVEALSWTLRLEAVRPPVERCPDQPADVAAAPSGVARIVDAASGGAVDVPVFHRADLAPGALVRGPALITEDETSTVVGADFTARINPLGYIVLTREAARGVPHS